MPVISVKSLPVKDHTNVPEILIKINNAVSMAVGCPEEHVWTYWEFINSGYYASGKHIAAKQYEETHSPIVTVTGAAGYTNAQTDSMFQAIAKTVSTELEISYGNVFITFNEVKPGMVFDGGETV